MSLNASKAAEIVRDAGGRVIGRTRLQKIAYLLTAVGLETDFPFVYKHYGPYSESLATATKDADLLGLLSETEQVASWGGTYSTFTVAGDSTLIEQNSRRKLAKQAAAADAIELELAATAVFLAKEGHCDPWAETARRKPEKAEPIRLDRAKALLAKLSEIQCPIGWPKNM